LTLGLGLILIGLAILMVWPRSEDVSAQTQGGQFKTVPAEVNYEAPSLILSDLYGQEHGLADYRGQIVLVNLWATWCPPCKAEMPTLQAYYEDHQAEGFMTIAISNGDAEDKVAEFIEDYGLTFTVLLDPELIAGREAFKSTSLPSSFVIDRKGQIRLRWIGEIDRETLEEYVTPLIME
jgi:peroxiredoxin